MKTSALPMPLIVGIFMVVGVFGMIALTLMIDDEGSLFSQGTLYRARFDTVEGLSPGSYVYMAGKKIGNVKAVEVDAVEGKAVVSFSLDQPYRFHSQDKLIIIQRSPITDSKRMDVVRTPGDTSVWPEEQEIQGQPVQTIDFAKLADSVTSAFKKIETKVDSLDVEAINGTFRGGQKIFAQMETGEGEIGKAVKNIREFSEALASKDGAVNGVLTSKEWRARIDKSLANIEKFTEDLNDPNGFLHKAMVDKKFADDLTGAVADLKQFTGSSLNNPNGLVNTLFNDKQFADDIKTTVSDVKSAAGDFREFADGLNAEDGLVRRLLNDKEWSAKADQVLADAATFMNDMKTISGKLVRGEGTIGKLLTDESLYRSVEGLVGEIRRAVDDAREFTPVSSALSAIIGVAR